MGLFFANCAQSEFEEPLKRSLVIRLLAHKKAEVVLIRTLKKIPFSHHNTFFSFRNRCWGILSLKLSSLKYPKSEYLITAAYLL